MNNPPSEISSSAYENRFGGWRNALKAFVDKMNSDDVSGEIETITNEREKGIVTIQKKIKKHSILVMDSRNISLGLRYYILNRDNFKCVKCGSSPATDTKCKLHIDHIVPLSKGGKTTKDNLQTLCAICNLGKGNRYHS
jgi:hypothetical protein